MPRSAKKSRLEKWEVSIIKAMLESKKYNNQEIVSYFSRPTRSFNQARIVDIKKGRIHRSAKAATPDELSDFLAAWPLIDEGTGLHLLGDELLVKAREAMLLAVQAYNSPKTFFRSETFIVIAMIAWTYLLHAYYKSKGIDYRYTEIREGQRVYVTTKFGAPKHWELATCLDETTCPLDVPTKKNLLFLIHIRHEIEHQMTERIDDALSAKLQACVLNFNRVIKSLFGDRRGLDKELTVALQFVSFNLDQQKVLLKENKLPAHILAAQVDFEDQLPVEEFNDPICLPNCHGAENSKQQRHGGSGRGIRETWV